MTNIQSLQRPRGSVRRATTASTRLCMYASVSVDISELIQQLLLNDECSMSQKQNVVQWELNKKIVKP